MQNLAVKLVVTPLLIGGASLAGRRWGHQLGGWLVALPLTSGLVAFLLATDHGVDFAATAAVGMLAGTISQVAFALVYRGLARRGRLAALAGGLLGFAVSTVALSWLQWPALATFGLVLAAVASAYLLIRRTTPRHLGSSGTPPRWDLPARMLVATGVVLAITAAAPVIGPQLAGLLSPLPVFGIVLAVFSHQAHGPPAAVGVLDGLVVGLLAPAVFFLAVAVALPALGLVAFAVATVAALIAQASTMLALPARQRANHRRRCLARVRPQADPFPGWWNGVGRSTTPRRSLGQADARPSWWEPRSPTTPRVEGSGRTVLAYPTPSRKRPTNQLGS